MPLIPVVVGGLIAILGAIAATALTHVLRTRAEQKAVRKSKLEILVGLLTETHHWAQKARLHYLSGVGEDSHEATPTSKIVTLAAVHFPELFELASALDTTADEYEMGLMKAKQDMLTAGSEAFTATSRRLLAANPTDTTILRQAELAEKEAGLAVMKRWNAETYRPVAERRFALLKAARELAARL